MLQNTVMYSSLFIALYFQVFLFLTFIGWREHNDDLPGYATDDELPTVTVMIPCWNEETTVVKTIESLLDLKYPKDKLTVMMIDDGSTDSTWQVVQQFAQHPQVRLLQKKNEGSKFAALNFGLIHVTTDVVGCLDADSRVDSNALRNSVKWFSRDDIYAVIPSMVIDSPSNILQYMQKVEYELATYIRHALSQLDSMYIAPGPFTLFRKEVFEQLGEYKEAHHTEDLEIALRMQIAGMRLVHAGDSLVYTHGPRTWPALLKQRIRWTYGFIKNMLDYKYLLFKTAHGDLGLLVLPIAFISLGIIIVTFPVTIYGIVAPFIVRIREIMLVGFRAPEWDFSIFSLPNEGYAWLAIVSTVLFFTGLFIARKIILKKKIFSFDLLTTLIYPYFASWWTIRSVWNALWSKKNTWR